MLGIAKMQEYKCIFWNLWLGLDPDMFFHPRFFQHYCHTHNSDRLQCFSCLFKGNDNQMVGQWTSFYMICPEFHGIPGRSWDLQDYPANTVRGRICLGLRLDWDKVWDLFYLSAPWLGAGPRAGVQQGDIRHLYQGKVTCTWNKWKKSFKAEADSSCYYHWVVHLPGLRHS